PQDPPGGAANERQPAVTPAPAVTLTQDQPAPPAIAATFTGTVRDAEAWPVPGATVQIVAGGGYKPFALGETTTDARGAFTVTASANGLRPRAVRLIISESGRELLATGDLPLPRPADAPPLELVLPASAGTATARFDLTVDVRDEAGLVLADVPVFLYGAVEPRPRPEWAKNEGHGKTGIAGQAVIAGRGLGAKWLFVDGRPLQRVSSFTKITVAKAGPVPVQVTLGRGAELAVVVKTVSGRALEWGQPWLIDERTGLRLDGKADGEAFRFRGLGDGPHTVMSAGDGQCSLAARPGVVAGGAPVTLTLKDRSDERDVGDHLAELHGELVDAVSGDVVEFGPFAVDVMPVFGDGSSLVFDGIEPPAPAQRAAENKQHRRFHETGLAAGRHAIVVQVPGYGVAGQVFELAAGQMLTGLRIPLVKQAVVRGRVVDAQGRPVKGATVFAVGTGPLADRHLAGWQGHRDQTEDPGARSVSFTPLVGYTSADGAFVVDQIPPGVDLRLAARQDDKGFVVVPLPALRAGEVLANFDLKLVAQ
ncbi:MAG: carboxypeptidase-like regulatory domain-containing protein, partial [Planctomycetota bacterium]